MFLRFGGLNAGAGSSGAAHVSDANTLVLLSMNNTGTPATFIDSSGYARTITTNGTVTQSAGAKKYGTGGATFGGTNSDYLSFADAAVFNLGTGAFTVEGWAKTPNVATAQILFWMGNSNDETKRFLAYMDSSAALRWFWKDGSNIMGNLGGGTIVADTYFHWCIQRVDADFAYVHLNGTQIGSYNGMASHSMRDWTGDLRIGEQDLAAAELPWLGSMDDFRFSNVARYGAGSFTP